MKIGSEIWTVLKDLASPRSAPLERLAERIDRRTELLRKADENPMHVAIVLLTAEKGE